MSGNAEQFRDEIGRLERLLGERDGEVSLLKVEVAILKSQVQILGKEIEMQALALERDRMRLQAELAIEAARIALAGRKGVELGL